MTLSGYVAVGVLAVLEGALVVLPRADALQRLGRLRSPAWAALLPGSIVLGTFGFLAVPRMAMGVVVVGSVATPILSGVAAVTVVRVPRARMLASALTLLILAELMRGWTRELSASMLTGLGCLTLGVALARLIPRRFILISVLCMCAVDVALLATGAGQATAAVTSHSSASVQGGLFGHAAVGPITTQYPDLVLAAVLGGSVAGHTVRWRAAVLVTVLTAGYGMFLPLAGVLPATVPIGITFAVLGLGRGRQRYREPGRYVHGW